jgi:hypothetical protein
MHLNYDRAFMTYECDWYAPEVAEPDTMSDITAQNLSMTIGDLRGLGFAPFFESCMLFNRLVIP